MVTYRKLYALLTELFQSGAFRLERPVTLVISESTKFKALYESEYDDSDSIIHIIRISKVTVECELDLAGSMIHELIHAEQAEEGAIVDHTDEFFSMVSVLSVILNIPEHHIADPELDTL